MKLRLLIGLSMLGLAVGGWALRHTSRNNSSPTSSLAPVIHVKDSMVDLGTISLKDGPFRATYELSNWGKSPLQIESTKSSCGCTQPRFSKTVIAPGETGVVELDISPNASGLQEVSVTLTTNDPVRSQFTLYAKWTGVETMEFTPLVVDFGEIPSDSPQTSNIHYRPLIDHVEVSQVTADPPELSAVIDGDHIVVTCRPTTGPGLHQGVVRIELKPAGQRPVQIPVHWLVAAPSHSVEPAALFFGAVRPGEQRTLSFRVVDQAGSFVQPDEVTWTAPLRGADFKIETDQVSVAWNVPLTPGLISGQITVEVGGKPLVIPVSGLVQEKFEKRTHAEPAP